VRRWVSIIGLFGASACSSSEGDAPPEVGQGSVAVGVPAGEDGLGFQLLHDGDVVKLQTFGQGGTHLLTGVRSVGFGNRAFVSATLTNLQTGKVVSEPPPARPQLLYCGDVGACDLVPYLVHASGIVEPDQDAHGVRVLLAAAVRNEAGVAAEGSCEVVLSTEDL
jgi:hypothetical protein